MPSSSSDARNRLESPERQKRLAYRSDWHRWYVESLQPADGRAWCGALPVDLGKGVAPLFKGNVPPLGGNSVPMNSEAFQEWYPVRVAQENARRGAPERDQAGANAASRVVTSATSVTSGRDDSRDDRQGDSGQGDKGGQSGVGPHSRTTMAAPKANHPALPKMLFSRLEQQLYRLVLEQGIPYPFFAQYQAGPDAQYQLDGAFPTLHLGIEADSETFHSSPDQQQKDLVRDQRLAAQGWHILRFTEEQITQKPEQVAHAILSMLARLSQVQAVF